MPLHLHPEVCTIRSVTDFEQAQPVTDDELDELSKLSVRSNETEQTAAEVAGARNAKVTEFRVRGVSVEQLKLVTGLSHQRIYQILGKAGHSRRPRRATPPRSFTLADFLEDNDERDRGT